MAVDPVRIHRPAITAADEAKKSHVVTRLIPGLQCRLVDESAQGDVLSGYVDLHTHVLPGMDDGAKDVTESLEMLFQAKTAGFTDVVVTPHQMFGVYEHDREMVQQAIDELADAARRQLPGLTIHPGSEYYLDEHFYRRLGENQVEPLAAGSHVLVELPMVKLPPYAKELAFTMQIRGWAPILAHPERYQDVTRQPKLAVGLAEAGYRLQINLGSLIGWYGRRVRKAAEWLLRQNLVDFIASDSHTPAQAAEVYGLGIEALGELVDQAEMQRLLIDNPRRALTEDDG